MHSRTEIVDRSQERPEEVREEGREGRREGQTERKSISQGWHFSNFSQTEISQLSLTGHPEACSFLRGAPQHPLTPDCSLPENWAGGR